jgi:hypothetical protein
VHDAGLQHGKGADHLRIELRDAIDRENLERPFGAYGAVTDT